MKGVTKRQERDIKKHVKHIKDAMDGNEWGEVEVQRRTTAFYNYLIDEGLILPPEYRDE